jgi:hypothetical protein
MHVSPPLLGNLGPSDLEREKSVVVDSHASPSQAGGRSKADLQRSFRQHDDAHLFPWHIFRPVQSVQQCIHRISAVFTLALFCLMFHTISGKHRRQTPVPTFTRLAGARDSCGSTISTWVGTGQPRDRRRPCTSPQVNWLGFCEGLFK